MSDIRINALATTATTPASDDFLALDGASQGTRKILATNIANNVTDVILGASGPSVKSSLAARAARQGLVFDGTTGATVASVSTFGTGDFTFASWVNPTSLTAGQYLIGGALAAGSFNAAINATTGVLTAYNGTSYTPSPNQSVIAGKWQLIVYRRASGVLYVSVNAGAEGSVACTENFSTVTSEIGALDGTGFFKGQIIPLIYNRALSATEVVSLYESGVPSGADYNTASNTALSLGNFANAGYETFTGASATGFTAINTSVDGYAYTTNQFTVIKGARYRMIFTCTLTSGQVPVAYLGVPGSSVLSAQTRIAAGSNSLEFTATASGASNGVFYSFNGESVNYEISNFALTRIGLLLAPDAAQAGGGLAWYDTSGNAANITLPASGVTWNVPTSGVLGGNFRTAGNLNASNGFYVSGSAVSPNNTASVDVSFQGTYGKISAINRGVGNFPLSLQPEGGNLLIGTTTDSGNGKLQLATHTTSAGGIGFGTDTAMFRDTAGGLQQAYSAGTTTRYRLVNNTGNASVFSRTGTTTTISSDDGAVVLASNNTTALTLASNQAATFAGAVAVASGLNNTLSVGASSPANPNPYTTLNGLRISGGDTSNTIYNGSRAIGITSDTGTSIFIGRSNGTTGMSVDTTTGAATFAGAVAINNTVATAAGVASTHKVTMVIGGVTYYLLASNV